MSNCESGESSLEDIPPDSPHANDDAASTASAASSSSSFRRFSFQNLCGVAPELSKHPIGFVDDDPRILLFKFHEMIKLLLQADVIQERMPENVPQYIRRAVPVVINGITELVGELGAVKPLTSVDDVISLIDQTIRNIAALGMPELYQSVRYLMQAVELLVHPLLSMNLDPRTPLPDALFTLPPWLISTVMFSVDHPEICCFLCRKFFFCERERKKLQIVKRCGDNAFYLIAGRIFVTGPNDYGQLGQTRCDHHLFDNAEVSFVRGLPQTRCVFTVPQPNEDDRAVAVFAVTEKGLYAWGCNSQRLLGLGLAATAVEHPMPVPIDTDTSVTRIRQADEALFFQAGASWYAVGSNTSGCLGVRSDAPFVATPTRVVLPRFMIVTDFKISRYSSTAAAMFAWTTSSQTPILACGTNRNGALGVGSSSPAVDVLTPVRLASSRSIVDIQSLSERDQADTTVFFLEDQRCLVCGSNEQQHVYPLPDAVLSSPVELGFKVIAAYQHPKYSDGSWIGMCYFSEDRTFTPVGSQHTSRVQLKPCEYAGWVELALRDEFDCIEFTDVGLCIVFKDTDDKGQGLKWVPSRDAPRHVKSLVLSGRLIVAEGYSETAGLSV
ncbi:hypothetical protein J8273_2703 [Carpediemonas membranifera]|uniref:Uncharacterized protein n=1 Tax=Carpediemonas membranifera TaxID=201153 RepID=A0A8J6AVF5_9EUKA|nr:hypothetical protein J8273_2703 [Carpediemonas membranifera]|eukprot:KAG9395791.1 hypothetical protein J8273_2703 [Carpediemonas membranifera]